MHKYLTSIYKTFNSKKIFFFLIIFLGLILGSFFIPDRKSVSSQQKNISTLYAQQKIFYSKWNSQINKIGIQDSYQKFKADNQTKTLTEQHAFAHLFGELLYDQKGDAGLGVCDEAFQYGCFHGLMGKIIQVKGTSAVSDIIQKCKSLNNTEAKVFRCEHAIGHGILGSFGYSMTDLKSALQVCTDLRNEIRLDICSGGIYMEYTFRPMQRELSQTRQADKGDLLAPCNQLDSIYQPDCYYQQNAWWLEILPGTNTQKVEQIVQLCNQLTPDQQITCARGLGNHLPIYLSDNYIETIPLCNLLGNKLKSTICLRQAAYILANIYDFKSRADEICASLTDTEYTKCHQMYE
jgi:hypothetical protein